MRLPGGGGQIQRHDHQGRRCEDDADEAFVRSLPAPQRPPGLRGHVDREQDECCTDELMDPALCAFQFLGHGPAGLERETPEHHRCGRRFDDAVESETEEGDAVGDCP